MAKVGECERELSQHLSPPKAAAYSASATDATITGTRWQKAWRGALWGVGVGSGWEGCDWLDEAGGTDKGLFLYYTLSATFWGRVEEVVGWVSESDRTTSHTARLRSRQVAGVGADPESHG